jgi:RNA polymerase sigma-70 factor, ECF subfamily
VLDWTITVNWQELPTEQLIRACATPLSGGAWEEFVRRFHPLITASAVRVSRRWSNGTPDEIDDVVQEIYLKLCTDRRRILTGFHAPQQAAIFGYIKVVATNIAHDFFRQRSAVKRGVALTSTLDEASQSALPDQLEQRLTLEQLDRILIAHTQTENGSRDRAIFRLYYRQGMTAQAISTLPGVGLSAKGVEAVLYRLTKNIRSAMTLTQDKGAR